VAEGEPRQVSAAAPGAAGRPLDALAFLRAEAPWLTAAELGTCIVGSQALAHACRAAGLDGPRAGDVDLAWALDVEHGTALLRDHGVHLPTTAGNVGRGTVACKLGGRRVEITTFRGANATAPLRERLLADVAERDMTIGAVAVELASGTVHDPHGGVEHWRARRVVPVGDPAARVREHAIRWLRYYRKAHELGFALERSVRRMPLDPRMLRELPPEAIALELRALLAKCRSPGRCLLELHEDRVLATLLPELVPQFDGRPAGPQRWHPEISQALHLVLALEWAVERCADLDERDRLAVLLAVLCHDLGKGDTPDAELPRHHGHEHAGVPHVERLLARWPGLADQRARTLALHVCALHLEVRRFAELRDGTLAELYDRWFRAAEYPVGLFALAVAADSGGRLGLAHEGDAVRAGVERDLHWLRRACASVDATSLRERLPDVAAFRDALHAARARAIAAARR
jgi:tRNA nucleotidyltransferase (CCA-adding enzyme)